MKKQDLILEIKKYIEEKTKDLDFVGEDENISKQAFEDGIKKFYDYENSVMLDGRDIKKAYNLKNKSKLRNEMDTIFSNYIKQNLLIPEDIKSKGQQTGRGVYIFVAKEDANITILDLFKNFCAVTISSDETDFDCQLVYTPKMNYYKGEREIIKKEYSIDMKQGEIIYVGEAEDLNSRHSAHDSSYLTSPTALKLGLRPKLKNISDYFVIKINSELVKACFDVNKTDLYKFEKYDDKELKKFKSDLEKYIHRKYGARFGK